jgi:integrase
MIATRYQKGSLLKRKRKSVPDTWVFRWYEHAGGKRTYRTQTVGTVATLPLHRDAEKAVAALRVKINSEIRSPETVSDLAAHYREHELERKAFASRENHLVLSKLYVEQHWGSYKLNAVRTIEVEKWLHSLPLAPASKTKIKSKFSVLYSHAIRHEWVTFNPISKVRCSAKRLRKKDVLNPSEFRALLDQLSVRDRAIVLLAGSTGLRRSEFIGLTWADVDAEKMEIAITRSCFRNVFGETKTECSRRPVPLHPLVLNALLQWKLNRCTEAKAIFYSLQHG